MENSFYYFFSATPQVLGGLIALTGVFVIFKLEANKRELLTVVMPLIELYKRYSDARDDSLSTSQRNSVLHKIINLVDCQSVKDLYKILDENSDAYTKETETYKLVMANVSRLYKKRDNIINSTIRLAITVTILIVFCLSIIPVGPCLLNQQIPINVIYGIAIIGTILCFYEFIRILMHSIRD